MGTILLLIVFGFIALAFVTYAAVIAALRNFFGEESWEDVNT
ncbi:hypothetical protein SAMN04487967_1024 [Natronorubrum sediminis]|uniref:Uncharacterized protein n=1 Tax=Natronorubrum sediminis TaxID=640943 RepID=A0A1H6FSQ3_9EURY|nr:hypothetical protein [Natronorubrum sediminis]SEH12913.1 hypothetical protein SAMN04487967_1024 [Natronorubrum sediminis]